MEAGGPADGLWRPEAAACSGGPAFGPGSGSGLVWSGLVCGCGCGRGDSFPGGNRVGGYGLADGCCAQALPTEAEAGGPADGSWRPEAAACSGGPGSGSGLGSVWVAAPCRIVGPRESGSGMREARRGGGGESGVPAKLRDVLAGRGKRAKDGAGEGDGYNEKTHRRMTVGFLSDRLCLIRLRLPRT